MVQKDFQKIGRNQCKYEIVYVFPDSGSNIFRIGGNAWLIEILTKIKVTLVGYDCDTIK